MASLKISLLILVFCYLLLRFSHGARQLTALVEGQPITMTYHKGALLTGPNLIWYGKFTAPQRSIITDFVASLSSSKKSGDPEQPPSVSSWWKTTGKYHAESKTRMPRLILGAQVLDESYSLGKSLKDADIARLAAKGAQRYAINVVLTSNDVAVEGFCMSRCGTHGSSSRSKSGRFAYIWVGNSAAQCPGQCAWPFHQPVYGPQSPPLVAPNGDVGVDGMVINLGSMLASTVTNPFVALKNKRRSTDEVLATTKAHSKTLQQLREEHANKASDINRHAENIFQSTYMDYKPSGETPAMTEPDVSSKATIESLRAMSLDSLLEELITILTSYRKMNHRSYHVLPNPI